MIGRIGYVSVCLCVDSAIGRKSMIGRTGYRSVCLCVYSSTDSGGWMVELVLYRGRGSDCS